MSYPTCRTPYVNSNVFCSGCGSGKYLGMNPLVFDVGVDRCKALTDIAREKDNEVTAVPDQLSN